jgi:hypothetical protein
VTRQRVLQVGLVAAAIAAVVVADRTATAALAVDPGLAARRLHGFLVVGGRVVAGWALGLAFRMQFTRAVRGDEQLRLLLGVPAGFLAAWPIVVTFVPLRLQRALPGWLMAGWATEIAPFAGVLLGLTLALAVRPRRA